MGRQLVVGGVVIVNTKPNLLEIVTTAHSSSRFASCLHRRQQQSDHDTDDRNDHQQFDKREACPGIRSETYHDTNLSKNEKQTKVEDEWQLGQGLAKAWQDY